MNIKGVKLFMLIQFSTASTTQLEDFPVCGFRNEHSGGQRDECLWDCEWVPNPFHRDQWTVNLVDEDLKDPENPNGKVVFEDVKYFMITPKLPKDLSCLSGCRLQEVVS